MPAESVKKRIHTDTCARCGCDRKEQRRGKFRCQANGVLYNSHIWGWKPEDEDIGGNHNEV